MIITLPIGGIIWIPLLYVGWKWIKLAIKIDFLFAYLVIRTPIAIVQILFHFFVGKPLHGINYFFHSGLETIRRSPKKYGFLMAILLGFSFYFFPISLDVTSMGSSLGALIPLLFVLGLPIGMTFVIASLIHHKSKEKIPEKELVGNNLMAGATGAAAGATAMGALSKADEVHGTYKDLQAGDVSHGEAVDSLIPGDMSSIAGKIVDEVGILGEGAAAEGAAAEGAAAAGAEAAGGAAAAANPVGVGVITLLVLAAVIFLVTLVIQFVIFAGIFFATMSFFIPKVAGPLMGALGVGQAYGNWATETATNKYAAGVSFDEQTQFLSEWGAKIKCAASGPACLRQWRLNNTKRPSSEDVGERYGLMIERFRVGSGESLDIAYKEADYHMPVSFQISNNRHGLDGIPARNIRYKIKVINFDHGPNNPFCQTDWLSPQAYDIDQGDSEEKGKAKDDLYPGTSAATGFLKLENLTLEKCHMLQPGAGEYRKVMLYVKYDYFSQATLYFQAMSRQNQNAQNIEIKSKDSVTADTPVKAALSVDAPALFDTESLGEPGYTGQPIPIRATLNTGENNVAYQVKEFKVRLSSQTCVVDGTGNCIPWSNSKQDFKDGSMQCSFVPNREMGSGIYQLTDQARLRLIANYKGSGKNSGIPEDFWFTESNAPDIFGCVLGLKEPEAINPSGETLTMGVAANYTVRLDRTLGSFEVLNSKCGSRNCPFIFALGTDSFSESVVESDKDYVKDNNETNDKHYWQRKEAMCDGVDAGDGCLAIDEYNPYVNGGVEISNGKLAVNITNDLIKRTWGDGDVPSEPVFTCFVYNKSSRGSASGQELAEAVYGKGGLGGSVDIFGPVGLDTERVDQVFGRSYAINYSITRTGGSLSKGWQIRYVPDHKRECYKKEG